MADITVPKGDYGFNLTITIKDSDNAVYDLSGYSPKLKVWTPGGTAFVAGTCALTNPTAGTVTYTVGSVDFTTAGNFKAEIEITKSGVIESTVPFTIQVTESA